MSKTSSVIASSAKSSARPRKAVVPPDVVTEDMSVFDYLSKCQPPLHQKIIDIACSQSSVPMELKDDAGQEIAMMWSQMRPDVDKYKPGQIASYAHQMARHAALRLRRELGSSVRLPGSAFRKRKDGSSYVTPGVLATALDWNELESWFQSDEIVENGAGGMPSEVDGLMQLLEEEAQLNADGDDEETTRNERLEILEEHRNTFTPRQYAIMASLISGGTYEEVMAEHDIKKGVLMREIAIASSLIGPLY